MPKALARFCLLAALALGAQTAQALDFISPAKHGAVLYESPAEKARKLFVVSRGTPFEVLSEQKNWLRVRDQKGAMAWMQTQETSKRRFLQVTKAGNVHKDANTKSAIVFRTKPELLLELQEKAKDGWIKIKHRDGLTGFIRIEEVWGL